MLRCPGMINAASRWGELVRAFLGLPTDGGQSDGTLLRLLVRFDRGEKTDGRRAPIVEVFVFGIGFAAGYGVRAWISARRRKWVGLPLP
jgi:hypothetical protein